MSEEMLDTRKENSENNLPRELSGETVICEAAGDYILPDYQPEIRKILAVRPALVPAGQYVGPARAEFTGSVVHTVLYTDNEGRLASASLPADYEFSVPLPEDIPCSVFADSQVEGTVCRPGGPRKLSLRTRVRSVVHVQREDCIAPEVRGMGSREDSASLEWLAGSLSGMSLTSGSSGEFTLSDTVRLEEGGEELRAVYAGGNLLINECRAREDGCLCRGEAWIKCLLAPPEGTPYTVRAKIPFEQVVPIDGMGEGAQCTAYGRVSAVDVSMAPGVDGGAATLALDVSAEIDACAAGTRNCKPTLDIYSTSYEMAKRYRTLTAAQLLGTTMANYTVGGSRPKAECDAEDAAAVVDTDGRVEIGGVTVEHGRAVVTGVVNAQMIFSSAPTGGEGAPVLQTAEIPAPFRIETDLRLPNGQTPRLDCRGELISARGRIEPNALAVDAEIALSLRASEEKELRVLEDAEPDRTVALTDQGDRIFVYYPQEGDTLWRVAARYHRSRAAIAAQNGLGEAAVAAPDSPASLDGVHHLLITE